MIRSICTITFLFFTGLFAGAQGPAPTSAKKAPTAEQIQLAIENLGSTRFAVREAASKLLWEAGAASEEALRTAATSKDEETSTRAKTILEKFDWGLYPDTPSELAKLIERFRGGDATLREEVVGELIRKTPIHFSTIRKLVAKEQDETARRKMYESMGFQARRAVPGLMVAGQLDQANELLEICIAPASPKNLGDFAAFQYLRKSVPETIKRIEAARKKASPEESRRLSEALAYLHRIDKNWPAARQAAVAAQNKELENDVAWEASDWKSLSEAKDSPEFRGSEFRGEMAAYHRLAGNKAKFDELIADLRKDLAGVEGDDASAFVLAYALLLNGCGVDAINVLKERPKAQPELIFDLLCAQLKYKEAFALADRAAKELEKDEENFYKRDMLDIQRGKVLASLGNRDAATQVFRSVLDRAFSGERFRIGDQTCMEIVKAVARAGMRDLAAECAARVVARYDANGVSGVMASILDPIVNEKKFAAQVWWYAFRKEKPNEEPGATMVRVLEFIDGKADRKKADHLASLIAKPAPAKDGTGVKNKIESLLPVFGAATSAFAIAEAYYLVGAKEKAEEFYKKAVTSTDDRYDDPTIPIPLVDEFDEGTPASVPATFRFQMAYADFLLTEKRTNEAAALYRKAWDSSPSQPLPLFMHGFALSEAGDKKEGARLMEVAHWVPLGDEGSRTRFSDDLSRRTFDVDSRREMNLIVDTAWFRSHYVGNVLLRLARTKARQKDYATAAVYYEKDVVSLFRTPTRFVEPRGYLAVPEVARMYRARALFAAGKIDEATGEVRAGIDALPGNVEMAIGFVPELDRLGKKKEADEIYGKVKAAFEGALKDFGSSPDLRNSLAWTMVNCNRDLDDALKHAEKAVANAPKAAGYIDTLAEIHFRKKDRKKALELMKQCATLEPANPYYRKQLERFEKKPFDSPLPDEETGDD